MSLLVEIGGRIPVPAGGIFSFSPPGSQAATPTFTPPAGGYTTTQTVTVSCSTPSSTIFYTTDGTTPTPASAVYSAPLTIASTQTLSAIATAPGFLQSNVATGTYTIIGGGSLIQKKFNPGFGLMTVTPGGLQPAEVSTIVGSGYKAAATGAIGWYHVWYLWHQFENLTLGGYDFSLFDNDMNTLQTSAPGCGIMVSINWYANARVKPSDLGTFHPIFGGVPRYIIDGSSSTYGAGPSGSPYSGWLADSWDGIETIFMRAAIWNANVLNRLQLMYQAFAKHPFTINSGPFKGNWTVDTCPLVEGVGTSTPTDTNMQGVPNVPQLYSAGGINSAFQTLAQTVETYFPHTATFLMPGFGPNGTGGATPSAQNTLIHAMLANPTANSCTDVFASRVVFSSFNNPPTGGTLSGNFTVTPQNYPLVFSDGQIRQAKFSANSTTVTWTGALTGSPSLTAVIGRPTYGQYYTMGSNFDSTPGFQTSLLGNEPQYPTVQGPDLGITHNGGQPVQTGGSNTGDSPTQTTNCINVAFSTLRATHVSICVTSDTQGVTIPAYWNANVKPVINGYAIPTINKELPLAYMFGPPITSVTVASSTSLNVVYPNFSGTVGANMTYNLYRDGTSIASNLSIGGGTFVDGGRIPGVSYTYTLQFKNDNGSGPVGPGVPATIPGTGPAITGAVVASATSVTLTWTPIAGSNNVLVFRNGVQSGNPVAASAGTTVDTGLAAGLPYTYTLKVSNASGTGPAGAPLLWNNPVFNFPNFAGSPAIIKTVNSASFVSNEIHLVAGGQHSSGGCGYNAVQNIQSFTCDFTFRLTQPGAYGMFFAIQNANQTTNPGYFQIPGPALSCTANGEGYASFPNPQVPCGNSIGIKFDSTNFNNNNGVNVGSTTPSSTGLYIDGGPAFGSGLPSALAPEIDLIPFGINVGSGNIMSAHLIYDGTILTMVISDTSTPTTATARFSWPVNIPAIVGANTAYLSFMAGTPQTGIDAVLSWSFNTGLNTRLAAPTFSVPAGQYSSAQSVSLSGPAGATIFYTTNGKQPTSASTQYTGTPINVSANTIVMAVALQTGYTDSTVAQANYRIGTSTQLVDFSAGFASAGGLMQPMGYAKVVGSQLVLNDATNAITAAAWYADLVPVTTFNTTFDLSLTNAVNAQWADACAFVLQNYPQTTTGTNLNNNLGGPYLGTNQVSGGPYMLGQNGGLMSYDNLYNSIAIFFNYFVGAGNNTGLYQNGVVTNAANIDMTSSGVSLHAGHLLRVNLAYDGTTLVQTVTDTVNNSKFTHSYVIDIPAVVGASSAWAGFTCGAGGASANVKINAWTYSLGAVPVFNLANFSGTPPIHVSSGGAVSGGTINWPNVSHAGGGAMYSLGVQNIQAFSTDFTFVIPSAGNYGLVFTVQNSNATTNPFGNNGINAGGFTANGIGWGAGGGSGQPACGNSVGWVFDVSGFNSTFGLPTPCSGMGLYVDGGPGIGGGGLGPANGFASKTDLKPLGLNLGSGHLMHAFITYDGTIATTVLVDTVTGISTRDSRPINIPAVVGANSAFIGFCQSQPTTGSGQVTVNSWTWAKGLNTQFAAPAFSVAAGQYTGTQTVALSGPSGASIYYTTNGTPPTTASTKYTAPISVSVSQVINAVAVQTGYTDSPIAQALYRIQAGALTVNFPSGFASNGGLIQLPGNAHLTGSNIALLDTTQTGEAGAAWFAATVPITTFSTTFSATMTADGMCFVLQGYPQTDTGTNFNWGQGIGPFGVVTVSGGPLTLSAPNVNSSTNLGYTDIFASIAIALTSSGVGLYQNGVVPSGAQQTSSPVNLVNGASFTATITYNGTALTITLTQGVNTVPFLLSSNINIPLIVGGGVTPASSAIAGFTAGGAQFGLANIQISKWTM